MRLTVSIRFIAIGLLWILSLLVTNLLTYHWSQDSGRTELNLSAPLVTKAALMIPGVDSDNVQEFSKTRNQMILLDEKIACVVIYPTKGVGRQYVSCFDKNTEIYLGGLGFERKNP